MKEMQLVKHLLQLVLSYNSKKLNCPSDMKGMRVIRIPFFVLFQISDNKFFCFP